MRAKPRFRVAEHAELLVFGGALVTLFLLAVWWASLLNRTIVQEQRAARAELALEVERAARDPQHRAAPDVVRIPTSDAPPRAIRLADDPGWSVDVSPSAFERLEDTARRRQRMVVGESGLLFALVATCAVMLYRLVVSQRAVQREMTLFVGQMSHEMKTPLAGLRALLETLARGRVQAEDLPQLLELGLQQVEREEHLIQTLLQAQRLRVAQDPMHVVALPLDELLGEFQRHHTLVPHTARFVVDATDAPVARADRDAVWTILENLVDNARKCNAVQIEIRGGADGGRAFISVRDDGRGFSPERAADLFRPFHSAHEDGGARHGTGLGLYICRRLAAAMGGDLRGESPGPGGGATFVLRLPLEPSGGAA